MRTYKNVKVISEYDQTEFVNLVSKAIEDNNKNKLQSEIHYSMNKTIFSAMILGYN